MDPDKLKAEEQQSQRLLFVLGVISRPEVISNLSNDLMTQIAELLGQHLGGQPCQVSMGFIEDDAARQVILDQFLKSQEK